MRRFALRSLSQGPVKLVASVRPVKLFFTFPFTRPAAPAGEHELRAGDNLGTKAFATSGQNKKATASKN